MLEQQGLEQALGVDLGTGLWQSQLESESETTYVKLLPQMPVMTAHVPFGFCSGFKPPLSLTTEHSPEPLQP